MYREPSSRSLVCRTANPTEVVPPSEMYGNGRYLSRCLASHVYQIPGPSIRSSCPAGGWTVGGLTFFQPGATNVLNQHTKGDR